MTVLVHSTCRLVRPVAHWAVTHRSGRIVAWGQEYLARYDVASPPSEFQFNLRCKIEDPRPSSSPLGSYKERQQGSPSPRRRSTESYFFSEKLRNLNDQIGR